MIDPHWWANHSASHSTPCPRGPRRTLSPRCPIMIICCYLVAQSCPTLCDPMDGSPPGSSVHGILQARILEWVATSFSKGSSQLRDQTHVSCVYLLHWQADSLPLHHLENPRLHSVQFSCSVVSDSLQPHELQHARPPCLSLTPGVYSNSCPSSR